MEAPCYRKFMAGRDKHIQRQEAISFWGKDLARRAGRKCELCEGGEDIRPVDTEPNEEPSMETLLLACARCREVIEGKVADPRELRFLEAAIWSEIPAVQLVARQMIQAVDTDWAREALELVG